MATLALVLLIGLPIFVCTPVSNDPALYDLQAKTLLDGGVLYRDILEPNLPGIVWIHVAIRKALGWSFEALRIADIVFFSVFVSLAYRWLRDEGKSAAAAIWTATAFFLFYLNVNEWCHCQRDMWMMPLCLAALHVRRRNINQMNANVGGRHCFRGGLIEGLLWASAFWIKPHVAVPALLCWIVGAVQVGRCRKSLWNGAGVLTGGVLLGAAGIGWMIASRCWGPFVETATEWNPRYVAAGKEHLTMIRFLAMGYRMFPWILLHLAAIPVALLAIRNGLKRSPHSESDTTASTTPLQALSAALYIGWLLQSFLLQHLFDYVHAPGIVLAILVLSERLNRSTVAGFRRVAIVTFLATAVVTSPLLRSDRLTTWGLCFTQGGSPIVHNRLAQISYPDWEALENVANYLEDMHPTNGEVAPFNNDLVYLYGRLNLAPPTRFVYLEALTVFFPDQRQLILEDLARSPVRYVISDLTSTGMSLQETRAPGEDGPASLPAKFPDALRNSFPWSLPIAYRSGSLIVHTVPRDNSPR